jgi:IS30 family transposase
MTRLSEPVNDEVWSAFRDGLSFRQIGLRVGRHESTIRELVRMTGGVRPARRHRARGQLVAAEREEISRGLAAGDSLRVIAVRLGRAPSTVSREVARNGGRRGYRATRAEAAAWRRACRPKSSKLALNLELREVVDSRLALEWSPEQIARWLRREFPSRAERACQTPPCSTNPAGLGHGSKPPSAPISISVGPSGSRWWSTAGSSTGERTRHRAGSPPRSSPATSPPSCRSTTGPPRPRPT